MDSARNRAGHMPLEDVDLVSEAPCQERTVMAQQELQIVRRVILELSPKCRKVFLLSRTHCKTYPEIAELCGISVKVVEKYISQALAALRRELGRMEAHTSELPSLQRISYAVLRLKNKKLNRHA